MAKLGRWQKNVILESIHESFQFFDWDPRFTAKKKINAMQLPQKRKVMDVHFSQWILEQERSR
jgi:hypothetical protein